MVKVAGFASKSLEENLLHVHLGPAGSEGRCCCLWLVEWDRPAALTFLNMSYIMNLCSLVSIHGYTVCSTLPPGSCSPCYLMDFLSAQLKPQMLSTSGQQEKVPWICLHSCSKEEFTYHQCSLGGSVLPNTLRMTLLLRPYLHFIHSSLLGGCWEDQH